MVPVIVSANNHLTLGVMTSGYPSAATDSAVQAGIVSAGYTQVSSGFPAAGTAYTLTNVNSGKLVTPANCGTANGTGINLWPSLGSTCQQWDIKP